MIRNAFYLLYILLINGCEISDPITENKDEVTITYEESFEDFHNPERGFYKYSETRTSNYNPLSENQLKQYKGLTSSSGSTYKTFNTLVFRYYVLDNYKSSSISETTLNLIDADFETARKAGVKVIPRFCYTTSANSGDCNEGFICPPYGDAPKSIVLEHINQLAPVINKNEDVILCIQMGFIGTWGENYYTDFFGDASSNGTQQKVLDENWNDRIEVLNAMLNKFSKNLMIQVRYPQLKQRAIYGINADTKVAPLQESEAFSGSNKARIGFHNDCLFASADDFGTYEDYGNSSTARRTDITNLKPYFSEDSKYVLVGGETCSDGYSPQNNCEPEGHADSDLRKLHYTYLNADYNNQVNNDWVDGGCMDSILLHLGYRIVLKNAKFNPNLSENSLFNFTINLKNVGYASPNKARPVNLILRNQVSGDATAFELDTDIRTWHSDITLDGSIDVQSKLSSGAYDCYLHFPDSSEKIADNPDFAIQLANNNIWEKETGYNNLAYTLDIP
ncbi:DUF4832 domain-containing protein [Portibacter lacus]|uniref:DUF4832 domain-containing protein n=1 Tax=Portibacter lacus TaxID=1099794 RepID=A0AA37WD69_9BACT|nr:DUF4832 domain-containing protein [Portibacter lacus]GLR17591.1 hypothetical protein GCM10007940_22060 [Portibacter lacus]